MARKKLKVGDVVLVVSATDETLPMEFVGRLGKVAACPEYQGVGDDPEIDPFWPVQHGPGWGQPACVQFYWTEEVERR